MLVFFEIVLVYIYKIFKMFPKTLDLKTNPSFQFYIYSALFYNFHFLLICFYLFLFKFYYLFYFAFILILFFVEHGNPVYGSRPHKRKEIKLHPQGNFFNLLFVFVFLIYNLYLSFMFLCSLLLIFAQCLFNKIL